MNNISISPNSKYIENNKNLYVFDNSNGSIKHILATDTVKTKDGKCLKSSNMHKNLNCQNSPLVANTCTIQYIIWIITP